MAKMANLDDLMAFLRHRKDLYEKIHDYSSSFAIGAVMEDILDKYAVDAESVVRCKDCMFFDREAKSVTRDLHRCKIDDKPVYGHDFCSEGELKKDGKTG